MAFGASCLAGIVARPSQHPSLSFSCALQSDRHHRSRRKVDFTSLRLGATALLCWLCWLCLLCLLCWLAPTSPTHTRQLHPHPHPQLSSAGPRVLSCSLARLRMLASTRHPCTRAYPLHRYSTAPLTTLHPCQPASNRRHRLSSACPLPSVHSISPHAVHDTRYIFPLSAGAALSSSHRFSGDIRDPINDTSVKQPPVALAQSPLPLRCMTEGSCS